MVVAVRISAAQIGNGRQAPPDQRCALAQINVLTAEQPGQRKAAQVRDGQPRRVDRHPGVDAAAGGHQRQRHQAGGPKDRIQPHRQAQPCDQAEEEAAAGAADAGGDNGFIRGRVTP